ncbi:hypothetical protein PRZ48_004293 [Zasmidium cellare]|uniref:Uncharacterized protein n=1 Tax=Zasmidium cellare TaxID=395010 RepID=A0ABR0ERC4_ZASCE|nr:hypothetical protein PRZ48_004293 [Zasmidium cellare]
MHSTSHTARAGSSSRPKTPSSANSISTFAESLRLSRTPSPSSDEAERIWEAARTAPPIFPDLNLQRINSWELARTEQTELPVNFQLGLGQRAVVTETKDNVGNRQSVMLVYESDDDASQTIPSQIPGVIDESNTNGESSYLGPTEHTTDKEAAHHDKGKGKAKARLYKLKQVFKLQALAKPDARQSSSRIRPEKPAHLPEIRPVQLSAPTTSTPQPSQQVPRKTLGHADRTTRWGDFSQYKSDQNVSTPPHSRPPPLNLNKPLPQVPHPNSHLRFTRAPETFSSSSQGPTQRKSANRRTAVYAGSIFSSPDMSEEEVIDTYDSSNSASPAAPHTPATSGDEADDEIERLHLLKRLERLGRSDSREVSMLLDAPYRSPQFSESVNDEIGRLNTGLDRTFDPDDEDDQSPMVDTFVHAGHTSFVITERLDENTIRSMYGTQERQDGDSPADDPAKALWDRLTNQVGGGGWSAD